MYDGRVPPSGGVSIDPGQFFKVHLKCNQAMYAYGSVTVSSNVSSNFRVDIYNSNQQLVTPDGWIFTGSMGTTNFTSTPFVNPNPTESDFYIRAWSYNWPIYDFTLNIDEYVASFALMLVPLRLRRSTRTSIRVIHCQRLCHL